MAMQEFSGWQYLLIDLANAYGMDKHLFEERIAWATKHLNDLELQLEDADSKPLYIKAMLAIRKAQKGMPTGHLVGFDACNSGMQIMSALTGCVSGATATGLVDPNVRADAYSSCTKLMNEILATQRLSVNVPRKKAKSALMTSFYGSKAQPKKIFGDGTPELEAFFMAAQTMAPGAWQLLQALLGSWQSGALYHAWQLPDGYNVKVKVMKRIEGDPARIEVDELDHTTFTYEYSVNEGLPAGHPKSKSNAANVVHSIDAYVLRCIHRRCNYDRDTAVLALEQMQLEFDDRGCGWADIPVPTNTVWAYYIDLWEKTQMADVVFLPHIQTVGVEYLPTAMLTKLIEITKKMLSYEPFEVVTVH